jgi:hypothetical protein
LEGPSSTLGRRVLEAASEGPASTLSPDLCLRKYRAFKVQRWRNGRAVGLGDRGRGFDPGRCRFARRASRPLDRVERRPGHGGGAQRRPPPRVRLLGAGGGAAAHPGPCQEAMGRARRTGPTGASKERGPVRAGRSDGVLPRRHRGEAPPGRPGGEARRLRPAAPGGGRAELAAADRGPDRRRARRASPRGGAAGRANGRR